MADKSVKLSTSSFRDIPICELCLEDALKAGAAKSEKLKPEDFQPTSVRFCVDGLYKCMKSYARKHDTSVFAITRDLSWYWASFCSTNVVMAALVKDYYALLDDISENTSYTDLSERMDESKKIEKVGRTKHHYPLLIPRVCHGAISDCAEVMGISLMIFYQLGWGKAMTTNQAGLYSDWARDIVSPLYDEVMGQADHRLKILKETRNTLENRLLEQAAKNAEG